MTKKINEWIYRKALEEAVGRIRFDGAGGESYPFEDLFYPLVIGEGELAFQAYADRMEAARQAKLNPPDPIKAELDRAIESVFEKLFGGLSDQPDNFKGKKDKDGEKGRWSEKNDLLYRDPRFHPASLIIPDRSVPSRILLMASAGHGKTTLLRRIALYYSHPSSQGKGHIELGQKYFLSGDFIPCLIELREFRDQNSLSQMMEGAIFSVLRKSSTIQQQPDLLSESSLQSFIPEISDRILLLVDGLDELSDDRRIRFLSTMDDYLQANPQTPIIMTSRVAGLSQPETKALLTKMAFRGRSIIPLTDEDARNYSRTWIEVTQAPEDRESLQEAMEEIISQEKFQYLKEFMRTPLELLFVLRQVARDAFSLNRFQMFRDSLWENFTGHVISYGQKRAVFEDTMTLLSFIAYQIQLKESMVFSLKEVLEMGEDLARLSFHTDLAKEGTLVDYREFLDGIAANVGIIESEDREGEIYYTFPIRSYQEFLAAHACCHLRLCREASKPDPLGLLSAHLQDPGWTKVVNFALSDLSANNREDFDRLVRQAFQEVKDLDLLRQLVEGDPAVTKDQALVLCQCAFSPPVLTEDRKKLLVACMNTRSAYAYLLALRTSYEDDPSGDSFLEAAALSSVLWEYERGSSSSAQALSYLQSPDLHQRKLGAEMVSFLARTLMDEVSDAYKDRVKEDLQLEEEVLSSLVGLAGEGEVTAITALTNLWLSGIKGSEKVGEVLDETMARRVIRELESQVPRVKKLYLAGSGSLDSPDYRRVQKQVMTLGSIPLSPRTAGLADYNGGAPYLTSLMKAMAERSKKDPDLDRMAMMTACLYYCWDLDRFMEAWMDDIYRRRPSSRNRQKPRSRRERNHFFLLRKRMADIKEAFRQGKKIYQNTLDNN
ncbi:NACHT domain-containing NTPase [Kallipyga massiliensis]|uniref:NACHT domain-containing protein n=1 Tax=Kallipyga massiliensis TaxID=1472764 RepID=UPI0026F2E79E|nr:NACHT domain-containing protein [Kallipyga massiliensis]